MGWLSLLTKGKKVAGAIKSIKPAKNLTKRRADFEDMVKAVDKHGKTAKSSQIKRDAAIKISNIHTKYDKALSDSHKANKKLLIKTVGGAGAGGAGAIGAHVGAKKKWPKYKKFMEQDIKTVDGKLKLVPRKKK